MKHSQKRATLQKSLLFEWPVPDVSDIGNFQRGTISKSDRELINRTLPRNNFDREKLWTHLDPVIRENRSPNEIVGALQSALHALETSVLIAAKRGDALAAQPLRAHIVIMRDALRYYKQLTNRRQARERLRTFRILRAWHEASGGKPLTISTPDNPERKEGERRGRGDPSGPLVEYLQTTFRIILGKHLGSEGAKRVLYRRYRQHRHFQYIGALFFRGIQT